jgi:shikimate kinase
MLHKPNLSELYEGRQGDYREVATATVPVSGRSPREVVADVLAAVGDVGVGE